MKRLFITAAALVFAVAMAGCFRPATRIITVSVPQMKSQPCADRITDAFKRVDGISNVVVNLEKRNIVVTYESLKLGIKNVQHVVADVGFDADDVKARDEARKNLPAECK